jgi:murein L,D-transpeptidase YafK
MFKRLVLVVLALLIALPATAVKKKRPRVNPRIARAIKEKRPRLKQLFRKAGVAYPARRVFIRIFKKEQVLELWARARGGSYVKVKSYPVCAASGVLGPKRRQGDEQVPEGFYHVRVFNPWSAFHLSMGINYPNKSDRILGYRRNLGGAIMIHGSCVSIGCVAIENGPVSEVFLAAYDAFRHGRKRIPVHIFPTRLDEKGMSWLREHHGEKLVKFWNQLRPGYAYFERHRKLPRVSINRRGRYIVKTERGVRVASAR